MDRSAADRRFGRRATVGEVIDDIDDVEISDAELARLALAADPDQEIDVDAVPFGADDTDRSLLPEWYMPAARGFDRRPRRVLTVALVVGALVLVNGAGLCVTYGMPEIAW